MKPVQTIAQLLKREGTGISWADFTFNPWLGCQKVSPACDHCYAETFVEGRLGHMGVQWGPGKKRLRTKPGNWKKPLRWNRFAAAAGLMLDVFCASLADWADNEAPDEWRLDLAQLILATPSLRWMLLTKRIGNAEAMLRAMFPEGVPQNVALGITVASQGEFDRDVPRALAVKDALGIRWLFLSMEPLLGPVDMTYCRSPYQHHHGWAGTYSPLNGSWWPAVGNPEEEYKNREEGLAKIDLVIVGGESGKDARPMHPAWAVAIVEACVNNGVALHFKQWGDWQPILDLGLGAGVVYMHGRKYTGDRIHRFPDGQISVRVGTRLAGHLFRGREYQERLAA